jgi:hypothetical protein
VEYAAWNPPKKYSFKADDGPFSIVDIVKPEQEANGRQINLEGQVEASGILKTLEGVVNRQAARQNRGNFKALKILMESG